MTDLSIVIPVFNALEETIGCVESVFASDAETAAVYLMDDGSLSGLADTLRARFGTRRNLRVISHFRNRGYTRNINFGLQLCETKFVCVLNSDTLVPSEWSAPLIDVLEKNPVVCGVAPVSNAASYQSIPLVRDPIAGFSVNDGLGYEVTEREQINCALRHFARGIVIDFPILNGFCTVFRTEYLRAVGAFDVQGFPQGYGEENDLCMRIKASGYRLQVVPSVFIHHQKSKSFGAERKKSLSAVGSQVLEQKYGPRLVPELAAQMDKSREMAALRALIAPYCRATVQVCHLTPDSGVHLVQGDASGRTLYAVDGPARLVLNKDSIRVEARVPNASVNFTIRLGVSGDLVVDVPPERTLPLGNANPRHSVLTWLAMWSHFEPVILSEWAHVEDSDGREEFPTTEAPLFDMLYNCGA